MEARNNPITSRILEAPVSEAQFQTELEEPSPVAQGAEELFDVAAAKEFAAIEKAQEAPAPAQELPKQVTRPKFDPETGERIVYPDTPPVAYPVSEAKTDQAFPDIPSG